jgi:hypothetical protein
MTARSIITLNHVLIRRHRYCRENANYGNGYHCLKQGKAGVFLCVHDYPPFCNFKYR